MAQAAPHTLTAKPTSPREPSYLDTIVVCFVRPAGCKNAWAAHALNRAKMRLGGASEVVGPKIAWYVSFRGLCSKLCVGSLNGSVEVWHLQLFSGKEAPF